MPFCSRISDFHITSSATHWRVSIDTPLGPDHVNFESILVNSIGRTRLQSIQRYGRFLDQWKLEFSIGREAISEDVLLEFLRILRWTVTISDDADESHALCLHKLPHPTDGPNGPEFKWTRIGDLVHQAKSYGPTTGSKPAALELGKEMECWIRSHPRYRAADVIIPAPAGNPNKAFDLPLYIAEYLSTNLSYVLGVCKKTHSVSQQKYLEQNPEILRENVHGKFMVATPVRDKSVIILDDLYGSGATLDELARACKAADAKTVLSFTATKNATFCQGISASGWYDIYTKKEQANDE